MNTEAVQSLMNQVNQLCERCQQANPDGKALQQDFLRIQQTFQTQVLPLTDQNTSPETIQPILTEMNRTFRLLGTDVAFMQAAKKSITLQQRQRQMAEKLQRLSAFCEALMKALMV
jgi:uncharacterized coiled-coil DUF342 family protein